MESHHFEGCYLLSESVKNLKLLQVGVGGWGYSWVALVRQSSYWEPVGYVDILQENLNRVILDFKVSSEQCFTDLSQALKKLDCDAVLVVVPPENHYQITTECLKSGKHVLVEKPLSSSIAEAKKMVYEARELGKKLMVSQNYRFRRAPRTVKQVLESGVVGKPNHILTCFFKSPNFGSSFRSEMEFPLLADMAIHHFDQMRYLLGSRPLRIYARTYNPSWSWFKGDPVADVFVEFEGDVYASYHGSWVTRGWETTWDGDWRIECSLGGIHWSNNEVFVVPREIFNSVYNPGMIEKDGSMVVDLFPMEFEDRSYSLFEFYQAILADRKPETSGEDNLYTLALTFGAITSARSGEWVSIEEILNSSS